MTPRLFSDLLIATSLPNTPSRLYTVYIAYHRYLLLKHEILNCVLTYDHFSRGKSVMTSVEHKVVKLTIFTLSS